jgi:hypothetical protein
MRRVTWWCLGALVAGALGVGCEQEMPPNFQNEPQDAGIIKTVDAPVASPGDAQAASDARGQDGPARDGGTDAAVDGGLAPDGASPDAPLPDAGQG